MASDERQKTGLLPMTGVILAGGRSLRLGRDKALMEIGGERLIDRKVNLLRGIFAEVIIVAASAAPFLDQPATIVTDIFTDCGPLGGLHAGLFYAVHDYSFVTACDLPFMNRAFVEHLAGQAEGYDVVVPEPADGLQPLHAVYSRRCLPIIKDLLIKGRRQIRELYRGRRILTIPTESIEAFGPPQLLFWNINTPADLVNLPRSDRGNFAIDGE